MPEGSVCSMKVMLGFNLSLEEHTKDGVCYVESDMHQGLSYTQPNGHPAAGALVMPYTVVVSPKYYEGAKKYELSVDGNHVYTKTLHGGQEFTFKGYKERGSHVIRQFVFSFPQDSEDEDINGNKEVKAKKVADVGEIRLVVYDTHHLGYRFVHWNRIKYVEFNACTGRDVNVGRTIQVASKKDLYRKTGGRYAMNSTDVGHGICNFERTNETYLRRLDVWSQGDVIETIVVQYRPRLTLQVMGVLPWPGTSSGVVVSDDDSGEAECSTEDHAENCVVPETTSTHPAIQSTDNIDKEANDDDNRGDTVPQICPLTSEELKSGGNSEQGPRVTHWISTIVPVDPLDTSKKPFRIVGPFVQGSSPLGPVDVENNLASGAIDKGPHTLEIDENKEVLAEVGKCDIVEKKETLVTKEEPEANLTDSKSQTGEPTRQTEEGSSASENATGGIMKAGAPHSGTASQANGTAEHPKTPEELNSLEKKKIGVKDDTDLTPENILTKTENHLRVKDEIKVPHLTEGSFASNEDHPALPDSVTGDTENALANEENKYPEDKPAKEMHDPESAAETHDAVSEDNERVGQPEKADNVQPAMKQTVCTFLENHEVAMEDVNDAPIEPTEQHVETTASQVPEDKANDSAQEDIAQEQMHSSNAQMLHRLCAFDEIREEATKDLANSVPTTCHTMKVGSPSCRKQEVRVATENFATASEVETNTTTEPLLCEGNLGSSYLVSKPECPTRLNDSQDTGYHAQNMDTDASFSTDNVSENQGQSSAKITCFQLEGDHRERSTSNQTEIAKENGNSGRTSNSSQSINDMKSRIMAAKKNVSNDPLAKAVKKERIADWESRGVPGGSSIDPGHGLKSFLDDVKFSPPDMKAAKREDTKIGILPKWSKSVSVDLASFENSQMEISVKISRSSTDIVDLTTIDDDVTSMSLRVNKCSMSDIIDLTTEKKYSLSCPSCDILDLDEFDLDDDDDDCKIFHIEYPEGSTPPDIIILDGSFSEALPKNEVDGDGGHFDISNVASTLTIEDSSFASVHSDQDIFGDEDYGENFIRVAASDSSVLSVHSDQDIFGEHMKKPVHRKSVQKSLGDSSNLPDQPSLPGLRKRRRRTRIRSGKAARARKRMLACSTPYVNASPADVLSDTARECLPICPPAEVVPPKREFDTTCSPIPYPIQAGSPGVTVRHKLTRVACENLTSPCPSKKLKAGGRISDLLAASSPVQAVKTESASQDCIDLTLYQDFACWPEVPDVECDPECQIIKVESPKSAPRVIIDVKHEISGE